MRTAAYRVRELKGSPRHGIGLAVSGLVRCIGREHGTIIPVSVRVADDVCASLPCVLGPDGVGEPLWPVMDETEQAGWDRSLAVLRDAGKVLPIRRPERPARAQADSARACSATRASTASP